MTDAALSAWIGRTEEVHDQLSRNLVMRIAATLG
ncbi:MAG: transposase, partial [Pseudomonas marincola]